MVLFAAPAHKSTIRDKEFTQKSKKLKFLWEIGAYGEIDTQ